MLSRRAFLKLAGLGLVSGFTYPVMIERYLVLRTQHEIRVPRLPPAFDGFTIVHLTDLHHGPFMPLWWIEALVAYANRIPRHVTVLTGDYVHSNDGAAPIDAVWPVLRGLHAPEGVYAVLGNHDHWADTKRSIHWLKRSGFNLRHRAVAIERAGQQLWLGGTGDLWEDPQSLDLLFPTPAGEACKIVLAHNPDSADQAFETQIDLMLCGHTHGGQVVYPGGRPAALPVRNRRYVSGLIQTPRFPLFISRGIGWAGYPVRFNCPPEIAVLVLRA